MVLALGRIRPTMGFQFVLVLRDDLYFSRRKYLRGPTGLALWVFLCFLDHYD